MRYIIQDTLGSHYETMNKYVGEYSFIISAIMTGLTFLFGAVDKPLMGLLVFCVIDMATGILLAFKDKEFTSKRLRQGIISKFMYFIIIIVANVLDGVFFAESPVLRTFSIWFYIIVEGSSIIENSGNINPKLPIPQFLVDRMAQIKGRVGMQTAEKDENGKYMTTEESEDLNDLEVENRIEEDKPNRKEY